MVARTVQNDGQPDQESPYARKRVLSGSAGFRAMALTLFTAKIGSVQNVVKFRANRGGLQAAAVDDIQQAAAIALWEQCLRAVDPGVPPFEIDCGIIATAGFAAWSRDDRKHRTISLHDKYRPDDTDVLGDRIPDRGHTIRVEDIELSAVDARLDEPVKCEHFHGRLLTVTQAAAILGVTRARAHQLVKRLGAVRFGCGQWAFPPKAVQEYARERGRRTQRRSATNAQNGPVSRHRDRLTGWRW